MIGEVGRCDSMACGSCHRDGRLVSSLTGCGVGRNRRTHREAGFDLAPSPRPSDRDSVVRPIIRTMKLKQREQVLRTIRSPCCEEPMLGKSQWPTAMDRDKSLVAHRRPRSRTRVSLARKNPPGDLQNTRGPEHQKETCTDEVSGGIRIAWKTGIMIWRGGSSMGENPSMRD